MNYGENIDSDAMGRGNRSLSMVRKTQIVVFHQDKKKAFDAKMNDYITKPIDFQKMEVVLKYILSKQNPLC